MSAILRNAALAAAAAAALSACSEDEPRLAGDRISIRQLETSGAGAAAELAPVPAAQPRADWTQRGGGARHEGGHVQASSSLSLAWRRDAGSAPGDRLATSGPVVAGGAVYVRDGESDVHAFDASTGAERWSVDLTPEDEYSETGYGGGLAFSDGKLFATTGFGDLFALSPSSGEVIWEARASAPYRGSPAAADGVVVAVTRANEAIGYDAATGERLWHLESALPRQGNFGLASPAIGEDVAVLPYGSGELAVVRKRAGTGIWRVTVVSRGAGEGMSIFPDVTSDPVLAPGPIVVAGNAGGALAAWDGRTARRLWQRDFGSLTPAWLAGDTLYVVTSEPAVQRISLQDGRTLWRTPLETFEDPEDREGPITYAGPVLAGGRVLLTASDGRLLAFDPQSGAPGQAIAMPGGSSTGPAAAGGTVYVLTDEGDLLAYR